ncbi:MAG: PilN domain-containing protein [Gemmatimonadota bacterium]|jgi:Tfp pilus assembly protein PilN|nr:MAG: PilN domain-containing protein [Gemmatimonadota bacterium]
MVGALVAAPLAVALLWFLQRARAGELDERLQAAVTDSTRLADLRALSDSLTERQSLVRERMGLIRTLDRDRFVWPHILDEVSRALPDFVWLTAIQETAPLPDLTLEIRGMAATALAVTEYVRRLESSPYLGLVRILGSQQQQAQGTDLDVHAFTLLVDYTPVGPPAAAGESGA